MQQKRLLNYPDDDPFHKAVIDQLNGFGGHPVDVIEMVLFIEDRDVWWFDDVPTEILPGFLSTQDGFYLLGAGTKTPGWDNGYLVGYSGQTGKIDGVEYPSDVFSYETHNFRGIRGIMDRHQVSIMANFSL